MPRLTSQADHRLIAELAALGVQVTPRQLERWRQHGLIATVRHGCGRGSGSQSHYPDGTVALVTELVALLSRRRSLNDAVLVLFRRGRPLSTAVVRCAYLDYFTAAQKEFARMSSRADEPDALVQVRRSKEGRALLRGLRRAGIAEAELFAIVGALTTGSDDGANPVVVLLAAGGFMRMAAELLDDDTVQALRELFRGFGLAAMTTAVVAAEGADLERMRDAAAVIVPFIADFIALLAFSHQESNVPGFGQDRDEELQAAQFVPFLLFAQQRGVDIASAAELEERFGAGLAAMAALLQSLKRADGRLFGPDAEREQARLKSYERERVKERILTFADANPAAIAAIAAVADDESAS
jgi:hypothetical protein